MIEKNFGETSKHIFRDQKNRKKSDEKVNENENFEISCFFSKKSKF